MLRIYQKDRGPNLQEQTSRITSLGRGRAKEELSSPCGEVSESFSSGFCYLWSWVP